LDGRSDTAPTGWTATLILQRDVRILSELEKIAPFLLDPDLEELRQPGPPGFLAQSRRPRRRGFPRTRIRVEWGMPVFDLIGVDADDTLWHNERLYVNAQARLVELLASYHSPDWIDQRLYRTEMRNLEHFGYGVKAFALSMIETAIELTEGRITGTELQPLIDLPREMLAANVELLEHVAETLPVLARRYPLVLITKGDLMDQERKVARSGLMPYFRHMEVLSEKNAERYAALLERHGVRGERFLMVGNSLRSDILPVLELGAQAVYIPHTFTWTHETAETPPEGRPGYYRLEHFGLLPGLLEALENEKGKSE
jgi:putative hydrolase of the HAD superfamily